MHLLCYRRVVFDVLLLELIVNRDLLWSTYLVVTNAISFKLLLLVFLSVFGAVLQACNGFLELHPRPEDSHYVRS